MSSVTTPHLVAVAPPPTRIATARPLRVLTVTSLFPSTARPRHGVFVETRLRHLIADCGVDARVIAPVPWFPFSAALFGAYGRFAATPRRDTRVGALQVSYPRYWMAPRVGVRFQPDSMARAIAGDLLPLLDGGWQPDLIDAHYFYPDGVAAAILAERLGLPLVITARGTDVNLLGRRSGTRERIQWAARRADAVIAVSRHLADGLAELGCAPDKITVLRNGVDVDVFNPEPVESARARLGLPAGPLYACVGNLVPEKGQALAVDALARLGEGRLVIVGEGVERAALMARAQAMGVLERVIFLPNMPQAKLRGLYSAVDALWLTSTREGWPNVVLEAMACGTPVVAVEVGAVADMITTPEVGRIVAARDPVAFAAAAAELGADPQRERVRRHATQFDWASISRGQLAIFQRLVAEARPTA